MNNQNREPRSGGWRGYGFALLAVAGAGLARWLLDPVLGSAVPLVTLFGAIAATVWIAGTWPAILAAVFGYAVCDFLFIAPRMGLGMSARNVVGALAYMVTSMVIILVGRSARAERRRAVREIAERRAAEQALRDSERTHRLLSTISNLATRTDPHDREAVADLTKGILESVAAELAVPRCGWSRIDVDSGTVVIEHDAHGDLPSMCGTYPLSQAAAPLVNELRAGRPSVVTDVTTDPRTIGFDEERFRSGMVRSFISVPLHQDGEWIANFWVIDNRPRSWTTRDVALMVAVAERTRLVIDQARVAAALRESEQRARVANAALQEADQRKDEFLAILSHELRNPLAPVRNAAHYLMMKDVADPELRRPIEMIHRQVAQMARLIDDLLDVSRITRGVLDLQFERFELSEVVNAAVDDCQDEVDARGHTLHLVLPERRIEMDADRQRLMQVFCNLIVNAAKYSPAGSRIDLTAHPTPDGVEVRVEDQGIGIPPTQLSEIFELFMQVDRTFERHGGLGIGLTLAKQLVELHGGTIEARSEGIGHGSTFVVRLPVATPVPDAAVTHGESAGSPTMQRILVADDNHDAAESLAMLLRNAGHVVREALDGESALREAAEFLPTLAFIDIGMPKVSGYDVARTLRAQPWGRSIHLVALTGWGQDEDRRRSAEAGFDTHLVKPVSHEDLLRTIHAVDPHTPAPASPHA